MSPPPMSRSSWACWLAETRLRPSLATQTCCLARQSVSVLAFAGEPASQGTASTPIMSTRSRRTCVTSLQPHFTLCPARRDRAGPEAARLRTETGPRVVVDFQGLLRRALCLGDVFQVEPDPVPRGTAPAHRVDQYV